MFLKVIFTLLLPSLIFAQNIVDQIDTESNDILAPDLVTEKIVRISYSKRIFIITNENASFAKGDFISLVFENKLVARALVAKNVNSIAGIKVLKIYSLMQWNKMRKGLEIQVIRGDDSFFRTKKKKTPEEEEGLIKEEEDLFDETTVLEEDDLTLDENKNRAIKNDNVVAFYLGFIEANNLEGGTARYNQPNVGWAYQIEDNIFIEASFGRNVIKEYPSEDLDTTLNNLTFKAKYAIPAPFYSVIKPYVGYQILTADSPSAGVDETGTRSASELALEEENVANLEKNQLIFGVTVLKRLVPGWFLRADLGSDILSAGLALEF